MSDCFHHKRSYKRVVESNGRTRCAVVCDDCGQNVRGHRKYIDKSRWPADFWFLPIWRDYRSPEAKGEQGYLF